VALLFVNTGRAGAVFHVYDKNHLDQIPRRYTVGAGDGLEGEWLVGADGGAYDLWVLGPNGFHRHFTGKLSKQHQRAPEPEIRVEYDCRRDGIRLVLLNRGSEPSTFRVEANAYQHGWKPPSIRVPARNQRDEFLALKHSANWYDFTVRVVGQDAFSRRFAGRVETGRHSLSDPAMGGRARGEHS